MRQVVVLALAFALLALACGGGGGQPEATATAQPTATALSSPMPAVTPETLAFLRDGDIWLIDADGSNERRLNLSNVESFSWVSSNEVDVMVGGESPQHLLVDTEGSVEELSFPAEFAVNIGFKTARARGSWSRDGSIFAVPLDQQIVAFDRNGIEFTRLPIGPPCNPPHSLVFGQPAFSPTGQTLLVAVNCSSAAGAYQLYSALYEVSLDGAIHQPFGASSPAADPSEALSANFRLHEQFLAPRFSPDGAHVAQMNAGGFSICFSTGLAAADADGANSRPLGLTTLDKLYHQEPVPDIFGGVTGYAWSPQSDSLAASFDLSSCDPSMPLEQLVAGLYILKLDGSPEEKLVDGPAHSPAWSPSGRYIAFVAQKYFGQVTAPSPLRVFDRTTAALTDLSEGTAPAWQPQPSRPPPSP
jgi:hypothetical protein